MCVGARSAVRRVWPIPAVCLDKAEPPTGASGICSVDEPNGFMQGSVNDLNKTLLLPLKTQICATSLSMSISGWKEIKMHSRFLIVPAL